MNLVERLRDERYITTADWILKEVREAADRIEALEAREAAHNEIWGGTMYSIDLAWERSEILNKGKDQ